MKHIFGVHSPISYLSALGVIIEEQIDYKDVVIVSETFGLEYEPIPIIKISPKRNILDKVFLRKNLKEAVDKFVDKFCQSDQFIMYVPAFQFLDKFLVIHPQCISFNFVEEGMASYSKYFTLNASFLSSYGCLEYSKHFFKRLKEKATQIRVVLQGYTTKIHAIYPFYLSYVTNPNIVFYGFHRDSHTIAKRKKTLSFEKIFKDYKFETEFDLSNSCIWVDDPDIHLKADSFDAYLNSINNTYIQYLKTHDISFTYIKYHYRQTEDIKRKINNLFIENQINIKIIPNTVVLEIEFLGSKNISVFGFYSSLLIYAKLLGHNSYSVASNISYCESNHIDQQYPIFKSLVVRI